MYSGVKGGTGTDSIAQFSGGLLQHSKSPELTAEAASTQDIINDNTKPIYGQRIVTTLIDTIASEKPEKPFALFPKTSSFAGSLIHVSYSDLARAVNRASWWLDEILQGRESESRVVAWIGPNDLRYCIFAVAANKTSRILLLPSPSKLCPLRRTYYN